MTKEETLQLGIEFERRLNSIDSRTIIDDKPDTETIYAYLNRAQDILLRTYYLADSQLPTDTRPTNRIEKILSNLIKVGRYIPKTVNNKAWTQIKLNPEEEEGEPLFDTSDILKYIRSHSSVNSTYNWSTDTDQYKQLNNINVKQSDNELFLNTAFDSRRIVRSPFVQFENDDLILYKDQYTNIIYVAVYYYRNPKQFSPLMDIDHQECELSIEAFDDLVSEALQLYVKEKYKLSLNDQQAKQQQKKQQNEDNQAEEQ